MNVSDSIQDTLAIGPIAVVSLVALVILTIEALNERAHAVNCWTSIAGLLAAIGIAFASLETPGLAFSGMVTTGGYANFFAIVFCLAGLLSVMLSKSYLRKATMEHGEYYSLHLLAIVGMMLMAAAADLIIFFLGLEIMSVSFYILAGFARRREVSNEAALKYFLLGAFATGFLLYGIALVYGSTGTTNIEMIITHVESTNEEITLLIGLGLLLVGLAFKIAAVPFHMWVPDVYEGSPTTVSGFMSTGGKAAAFSALLLIFAPPIIVAVEPVKDVIAVVAVLSMVLGNIAAIVQSNMKRMLAYSSIAHAGYMLVGVVAGNEAGSTGVLFYLVAYTAMNVGAFGVLSVLESGDGRNLAVEDYAGLSTGKPVLAALMALFMFSLTGIPPFAGFFGKYYVFAGAVEAGYTWLVIVGVLMSAVSAYYYLRIVVAMYFKNGVSAVETPIPRLGFAALVIAAASLVGLGIFPSLVLNLTTNFF
jgi:NADH-quinone oxidoreductase subunit N